MIIKNWLCTVVFFALYSFGSEVQEYIQVPVKTYMLPIQRSGACREFKKLLDSAQREVLIAMYWITDRSFIEKIVSAKKRGVNVQIIFDESTLEYEANLVDIFLKKGIIPIVFPSKLALMHNKFIIVDGKKVWTGSANFTIRAFSGNHENIVIIDSTQVAKEYIYGFNNTKDAAFNLYMSLIAGGREDVPDAIVRVINELYRVDQEFMNLVKKSFVHPEESYKKGFIEFFPDLQQRSSVESKESKRNTPDVRDSVSPLKKRHAPVNSSSLSSSSPFSLSSEGTLMKKLPMSTTTGSDIELKRAASFSSSFSSSLKLSDDPAQRGITHTEDKKAALGKAEAVEKGTDEGPKSSSSSSWLFEGQEEEILATTDQKQILEGFDLYEEGMSYTKAQDLIDALYAE